ncbi:hypothetical protein E2C01_012248 [Portunus trituberculatus]|uniref:Uncharacterized protein n=1 Tax=Portunus trituberculatus TaxID=210409 RepID=A0A5B7DE38_PORTR|nr:hypothetical protein [Portunus trituberculatus]
MSAGAVRTPVPDSSVTCSTTSSNIHINEFVVSRVVAHADIGCGLGESTPEVLLGLPNQAPLPVCS